jgi:hypothetical protein
LEEYLLKYKIFQEFKNGIVEGPKFSICIELCEGGFVKEYYEFKNEKTNEVFFY